MYIFDKIQEIFWPAILAGGIAGLLLTGMQLFMITPKIVEAETYEVSDNESHTHAHESLTDSDHGHTEENEEAWAPADGAERAFYTSLNSIIVSIGFGLLLTACYALRGSVTWRRGILWGIAGFAAFHLAPALGLPPKLPGDMTAELGAVQTWWWLTVIATAAGLWILAFQKTHLKLAGAIGAILITAPHLPLFGAPQPQEVGGLAPQELRNSFIFTSLTTNAIFWVVLGILSAWFFNKIGKSTSA